MDDVALFTCGGEAITPEHLLAVAASRGKLDPLRADARARLAALEHSFRVDYCVEDALLQERSEDFRRDRGLRTARATEQWMQNHGVTLEAFGEFLEREACRQYFENELEELLKNVPVDENEIASVLWPDAVFSGACDVWCGELAGQLAVYAEHAGAAALSVDRAAWPECYRACLRHYEAYCAGVLTPERLNQALQQSWQDCCTFDCEIGQFESAAAAREACLCVREDGEPLASVCATAHGRFARRRLTLRQFPDGLQMLALSAVPGTLLPPLEVDGYHLIYFVVEKHEPGLHDEATRAILSETLLAEAVRPYVQAHIQWAGARTS